jgi:hypothetical protein
MQQEGGRTSQRGASTTSQPGASPSANEDEIPPPLAILDVAPPDPSALQTAPDQPSQSRPARGQASQNRSGLGSLTQGQARQGRGGLSGARGTRQSQFSQYVDLQTPAKFQLETPLDIIGATVVIPQQNATSQTSAQAPIVTPVVPTTPATAMPSPPADIRLESPLMVNSSTLNSTLITYLDETSTSPRTTIVGRINLNEAPYEVVAGIPGLSQNAAMQIVNRREQQANGMRDLYRQPTWLLQYNIVDLATLKKIWPHVTCGGDVFRGQVISFYEDIGTFSRVDVAVDATVFPPRLVDSKDLTSHGIGFHDRVLFGNIPRQGSGGLGGVAGSTAPSMTDLGSGGGFTDRVSGMNMPPMPTMPQQQSFLQPSYDVPPPLEISQ